MEESTQEAIELTDEQIAAVLVKAGGCPSPIIDEVLATLRPRVERMIRQRFGIGTDSLPMTLEEIGRQEGLSRERIR